MIELRDITTLRLHPDSERVPMAAADDLARLRASLEENGQQDPIHVTGDVILDGRTRWKLLGELGTTTIQVQDVAVPDSQQTNYIVHRALDRRHLTAEQKRVLNALLREVVEEVEPNPVTGDEMRIGQTVGQRAETLGVEVRTVRRWDKDDSPMTFVTGDGPTHIRHSDGKVQPIRHPVRRAPGTGSARDVGRVTNRPTPLRKSRPVPAWSRHFSLFCRRSRPEDHEFLLRMAREIHAALRQNDIEYEED